MREWEVGDTVLCISEYGWSPGCVTKGKIYQVCSVRMDNCGSMRITIMANHEIPYVTNMDCFKLISEVREERLNQLGI